MKKIIIVFLVLITVILFFFAVYTYVQEKDIEDTHKELNNSTKEDDLKGEEENAINGVSDTSDNKISIEDSVSTESSTNKENSREENKTGLPSDLYTVECGFYFGEYGVCGGVCPEGECKSEGKSCYCKRD